MASGQAASTYAVLNVAEPGDNFVTSTDLYGGSWALFASTLKHLGIEARFVDPADPENFCRATDARTKLYYAEALPNPKLHVFPIREVADIGRSLAIHPATTTHSQLTADDQPRTGVTPGYVRLSVGIEHPDDILADLAQALERA